MDISSSCVTAQKGKWKWSETVKQYNNKKIIPTQLVLLQGPMRSKFHEYILHACVKNLMSELKTIFIINFS